LLEKKKSLGKNIHIIRRDRRALLLLLSLTPLSTPPILLIVVIIHGSGEVFHLGVVCLEWEQEYDGSFFLFPPKTVRLCVRIGDVFPVRSISRVFTTKRDDAVESRATGAIEIQVREEFKGNDDESFAQRARREAGRDEVIESGKRGEGEREEKSGAGDIATNAAEKIRRMREG